MSTEPLIYPETMDDELAWILGLVCCDCIPFVRVFRSAGVVIQHKAEAEQAFTIDWMLKLYLRHGPDWREVAKTEIDGLRERVHGG